MRDPTQHILIVDDEPAVIEALTAALKGTYVVHGAASGKEACAILCTQPIAAILLDVMLGEEQGLDLVGQFRTLSSARILILTGHSSEELAIRAVWAQVDGYLKKPVPVPDLHRALARLIPCGGQPADLAAKARRYLDEHLAKRFCPTQLAGTFGVSESYLRRCLRQVYGKTPRRYLTEARLRQAAILLSAPRGGVEQIADDVGFPNGSGSSSASSVPTGCARRSIAPAGDSDRAKGERRRTKKGPDAQNGHDFVQKGQGFWLDVQRPSAPYSRGI
jgi:YesN/AraC family two-component response regulator